MINTEEKVRIYELRASGSSIEKIAKEVGVAKQTVVDAIRDGREEVAALEALQLEALYEAERITHTERIRSLALIRRKLQEEIESRDFSTVPTEKLVDMYLKASAQLSEEMIEPDFRSSQEQKQDKEDRETLSSLS